jgi:hypothetical protein
MDRKVREVRRGPQFELSCRRIEERISLADMQRLLRSVTWLIGRAADDFPSDSEGLRTYVYEETSLYPSLVFYFTIDSDELCTLRYVEAIQG